MSRWLFILITAWAALAASAQQRSVSGIHPHLAMFNNEGECGTGTWSHVATVNVRPRATAQHKFPDAFGAYWLRVTASADTQATAQCEYD